MRTFQDMMQSPYDERLFDYYGTAQLVAVWDHGENSFAADLDGKGRSFSFTFAQPGSYRYYCDRHEHMRGEVLVVSSTN